MTVTVTWDEASARRLERQFLDRPAGRGTPVADVVGAMLGAHAQVLSAAEVSVGMRVAGVTRADVRAALWEDRSLVKTFGPRGTVHLLPAAELSLWCGALSAIPTGPSPFPPDVAVTEEQAEQIVAAIADALDGVCLTVDELSTEVIARTGPWAGDLVMPAFQDLWPRWRQVMHRAGQAGALCFGPNRGRKVTYTRPWGVDAVVGGGVGSGAGAASGGGPAPGTGAASGATSGAGPGSGAETVSGAGPGSRGGLSFGTEAASKAGPGSRVEAVSGVPRAGDSVGDGALRELVLRYLRAYGPATPQYFAKWLAAPVGWAVGLFGELAEAGEVEEVSFEGAAAWVAAGDTEFPGGRARGVRLLPYFDAYAIAAQPRESLFPGKAYRRALAGGQAGNYPVLLVDGVVAGVWHQRRQGRRTTVTVEVVGRPLTARQQRELGKQTERVGEVLEARAELVVGEVTVGPHA